MLKIINWKKRQKEGTVCERYFQESDIEFTSK